MIMMGKSIRQILQLCAPAVLWQTNALLSRRSHDVEMQKAGCAMNDRKHRHTNAVAAPVFGIGLQYSDAERRRVFGYALVDVWRQLLVPVCKMQKKKKKKKKNGWI